MRTPQTRLAPPLRRAPPGQQSGQPPGPSRRLWRSPVLMPPSSSNDASTVNATTGNHRHGALSAQRLPGPRLTPQRRLFPGRSPRQSSANAARGGLRPPPEGRSRGATKPSSSAQHDKKITYLQGNLLVFDAHTKPSPNAPRFRRTQQDVPRHQTRSELRQPDPARRRQTKSCCMACRRSGVRIPLAPPFFACLFEGKVPNYWHWIIA